jgi:phosphomannomutase
MKIVADAGNGSAGVFMEMIREAMGFTLIPLFFDPDGDFPHHHPNPMMEENRRDARRELLETHADIAFIFDGDADRIMLLDEE